MSVTGVIVEYNPLHNGHLFHIQQSKVKTGCKHMIAVMSGNFVQRGEPSVINKWQRTKMALNAGIDLVIELPFLYCNSSAEGFAFGAVSALNSLGIVDYLSFGSESNNIELLRFISEILVNEPLEYKEILKTELKKGLSFPAARQNSLIDYIEYKNIENININEINNVLINSNNILAIEYIKAILKLSSNIKPVSIQRIINRYNQSELTGDISSATSIRKNILNLDLISNSIPDYTYKILKKESDLKKFPINLSSFSDLILYKLRYMSLNEIENIAEVTEGFQHKLKTAAENNSNVYEIIEAVKNKRYTSTRIQRILINLLLGVTKKTSIKVKNPIEYIRVLGFSQSGRELLKKIKGTCKIPIITNPSSNDISLLHYDILATDIYVMSYANPKYRLARQDLKVPPIIL